MYYSLDNNFNNKNFTFDLANLIIEKNKTPIFLCVGSNKIVEDSLGSITGELLQNYYKINAKVFGSFNYPLVGERLKNAIEEIQANYYNNLLIVIDSSVGSLENLYNVSLNNFGLQIDFQNNKKLIGDIGISSVTYVKGINDLLLLNSEKKKCIFNLANYISSGIFNALKMCENLNFKLNENAI